MHDWRGFAGFFSGKPRPTCFYGRNVPMGVYTPFLFVFVPNICNEPVAMEFYFARNNAIGVVSVAVDNGTAAKISFKKMPRAIFNKGLQKWLDAYFKGGRPKFPFKAAPHGTPFQLAVWRAMAKIRFGHAQSYGQIAKAIGCPKAVRAVGSACGANPLPLLIPCHRVVASSGLGGFSGGIEIKRRLLKIEGLGRGMPSATPL